jgi:importin subunit alpha-2
MRQRRQEVSVELRKKSKEDQLLKRRNIEVQEPPSPLQEINAQSPGAAPSMSLDEIMTNIEGPNPTLKFQAVQGVRKMLSREKNPPIDIIINMNLVPKLIQFLEDFEK